MRRIPPFPVLAAAALALAASACSDRPVKAPVVVEHPRTIRAAFDPREHSSRDNPRFIRLDDIVEEAEFSPAPPDAADPGRVWEFDGGAAGWTLTGGGEPAASDGQLAWRVGSGSEGIVSPEIDLPFRDLRAIEIRCAASAGRRLRLWWAGSREFDPKFTLVTEIETGNEPRGYVIRTATLRGFEGLQLHRLRLDPSDGEAADVRVESIRLVGREGFYGGRSHGLSREMIGNEHRHVVFHRAPSEIAWTLTLPEGAVLDVGAGLLEARSGVELTARIEERGRVSELLRETIRDDTAWHDFRADLSRWGGRSVRLVLRSDSPAPGQVVLWSNPIVVAKGIAAPDRPNVIVYLVDTLRADHVGANGHANATTPTIDRLAAEGVLFERCSAAGSWTRPSVASLVTSLAPPSHGVTDHGMAASEAVVTLAEQLRRRNYLTAAFSTSGHPGSSSNLHQGYDIYLEPPAITGDAGQVEEGKRKDFTRKNAKFLNNALFPWLERNRERPFFLYLHTMDPHAPYEPPAPYDTMFATGYRGPVGGAYEGPAAFSNARTPEELAHVRALYDGDVRDNDDRIAELVEVLREAGLLDRTLIVVTSDHGEEFREHGKFEHGQSLYRELLDVPLVLRLPGAIPAGVRVETRVSGLDVMPTILTILGIDPNPDVQGQSLVPMIREAAAGHAGPARPGGDVFSWRRNRSGEEQVSVERGEFKAIVKGRRVELYDRSTDPSELNDIARKQPELAAALAAEARGWLASLRTIVEENETASTTVDAEQRKWLEALGYVK